MSYKKLIEDWEFNVLDIYNYRKPGQYQHYFDYIIENHDRIPGDLLEAGVFRGRTLIGMGLMLKELQSNKIIYGYDSWSGFPSICRPEDDFSRWERLYKEGKISSAHLEKVKKNHEYRKFSLGLSKKRQVDASNISLSGDFSECSREEVQEKLDYLGLDNVRLVQGNFSDTMAPGISPSFDSLMAVLIDADLYLSYKVCLPFIWKYLNRAGYIMLDEYYSLKFPGPRIACDEFFADLKDKPQRKKMVQGDFERWYVRRLYD